MTAVLGSTGAELELEPKAFMMAAAARDVEDDALMNKRLRVSAI